MVSQAAVMEEGDTASSSADARALYRVAPLTLLALSAWCGLFAGVLQNPLEGGPGRLGLLASPAGHIQEAAVGGERLEGLLADWATAQVGIERGLLGPGQSTLEVLTPLLRGRTARFRHEPAPFLASTNQAAEGRAAGTPIRPPIAG
jgi:hypothetical protein